MRTRMCARALRMQYDICNRPLALTSSMNYVIRVDHRCILEDNPVATRVGVAVNFGPSLAAEAGLSVIKGCCFILAACSRTQSGLKNF